MCWWKKPRYRDFATGANEFPVTKVRVPIEDSFDLHSFLPRDVANVVADYLEAARQHGLREVRVIHGKGTGALRERVAEMLTKDTRVRGFRSGAWNEGGAGVTFAEFA